MIKDSFSTEQIWELLSARLRSFFLKRVSDDEIAEDLLQETFLRIHTRLESMQDQERVSSWVFQIARNLVIDHYRSRVKTTNALTQEPEDAVAQEENLNSLVVGWLPRMIAMLPEPYREAMELSELKGLPQQQIADQLGISLSGAKSRIQRGRIKLKGLLLECCSFEQDRRGNVIDYARNQPSRCSESQCVKYEGRKYRQGE